VRFLLVFLALPLWAADDVDAIIRRLIEADQRNAPHIHQYTFTEQTARFEFSHGQPHQTGTQTHEVVFVEGMEYRKLVARDGKPLSAREQARVAKDMAQTAEERRKHLAPVVPGGVMTFSGPFVHRRADLGSMEELLRLYDNRVAGEETVRGHRTWVLECSPRQGYTPASEHEREVLVFRKTLWVDEAEGALVRGVYTVAVEGSFAHPGSTLTFDYDKIDAETWQMVELVLNISTNKQKVFQPNVRTEYQRSGFHKFDVQSTITVAQ
jgi:hypothetical protein